MEKKSFKGKALYNPSGKAGEYSQWAVNFYNGCSGRCTYCYMNKGVLSALHSDTPIIKKSLGNEYQAFEIFCKELEKNKSELQKHGLFFNFNSDPFLPDTWELNVRAIQKCIENDIPVKTLTKQVLRFNEVHLLPITPDRIKKNWAIGFTLTGRDDLEPGCATNIDRIKEMIYLHDLGFITWASIEPVIDICKSFDMVLGTTGFCDHYKIGLESGKKFDKDDVKYFIISVNMYLDKNSPDTTIYWKDDILKKAGISRDSLPSNCVSRDFNIFK
jgi:DNA repair photolyase